MIKSKFPTIEIGLQYEIAELLKSAETKGEHEKDMMKIEKNITTNYYLKLLSHLTLRSYLEKFFNDIVLQFLDVNSSIHVAINSTATNNQLKDLRSNDPKKSKVNAVLTNSLVQSAVWGHFNFSTSTVLPEFSEALLYGAVSEVIHRPNVRGLLVSDKAETTYKDFFATLATRYNAKYTEYDEEQAMAAENMFDFPSITDDDDDANPSSTSKVQAKRGNEFRRMEFMGTN
eukprot:gene35457-45946_t